MGFSRHPLPPPDQPAGGLGRGGGVPGRELLPRRGARHLLRPLGARPRHRHRQPGAARSSRSSPRSGCTSRSRATGCCASNALLDSDSVAGAFDFTIEPGDETVMHIRSVLFPRRPIAAGRHRAADLDVLLRPRAPRRASTTSATRCTTATASGWSTAPASGCGGRCAIPAAIETSAFADNNPRGLRADPARARPSSTSRTPRRTTSSARAPGSSRRATGAAAR